MKAFLIIFILAVLFVVGSASAMRYFGNPTDNNKQNKNDKNKNNEPFDSGKEE